MVNFTPNVGTKNKKYNTGHPGDNNTTAHTFRWTAKLLDLGIDAAAINRSLAYTKSPHDLQIQKMEY